MRGAVAVCGPDEPLRSRSARRFLSSERREGPAGTSSDNTELWPLVEDEAGFVNGGVSPPPSPLPHPNNRTQLEIA